MAFPLTPTEIEIFSSIYKDPLTGLWTVPILTFNTTVLNPFFIESDPLNEDPRYRKRVIENIHMRLTEKWLYSYASFRSLLKYFKVDKNGEKGTVSLIDNPDKTSDKKLSDSEEKYVFKYIENYFATKKFVEKILTSYVKSTHMKWYDIFNNIGTVKDLLVHKLKKIIVNTIYELQKDSKKS